MPEFNKTAIIGTSGFIGRHFLTAYRKSHPDSVGTTQAELDLKDPDIAPLRLNETGHKEALIFAAKSKVAWCEKNQDESWKINVTGTLALIRQLVDRGIKPIFASSDYVFDGKSGSYVDEAKPDPKTAYGAQKFEVERCLPEITKGNHLVLRISKVFSLERDGTLLDEMAAKIRSGERFRAAHDQIFSPTLISDLIAVTKTLQNQGATGIVNACGPEIWSRYKFAVTLAEALKIDVKLIEDISLDDLKEGFSRPKNTSLINRRIQRETVYAFTTVQKALRLYAGAPK